MRFLADMGISPQTVAYLTELGYDATHLHQRALDRLPDVDVIAKAYSENRIILTHDLDFGELYARAGTTFPSVIIFRLRNMNPDCVNRYLKTIIASYRDELESGAILTVTEGRLRVRSLPVG